MNISYHDGRVSHADAGVVEVVPLAIVLGRCRVMTASHTTHVVAYRHEVIHSLFAFQIRYFKVPTFWEKQNISRGMIENMEQF